MKPVDYETFMAEKEDQESITVDKPDETAVPVLPPRPKRAFGTPILIGAIIFLLIISFVGIYYSFSSFFEGGAGDEKAVSAPKGSFHTVFVDSDYSVYNPKVDSWTLMKEGDIPFGLWTLTGNDSRRNIFTLNKEHSIRAEAGTKFKLDDSKPTDNFKTKVIMEIEDGDIWIEGAGDMFEVKTPRGTVSGDGSNFQITVKDKGAKILAWKGNLTFIPDKTPDKVIEIKEGKMMFIDSMDNMIPPPPNLLTIEDDNTDWQLWNKSLKSEDLVGEKPVVAEIAKKVEVKKELKEAVPVEDIKEPHVADAKKPGDVPSPPASSELEKPVEVVKKPNIPKIEIPSAVPTVGNAKKPSKTDSAGEKMTKVTKTGKSGKPAPPGGGPTFESPPPIPNDLLEKTTQGPHSPGSENPQAVHKVHSGTSPAEDHNNTHTTTVSKPGGNVLDAPVQSKDVLNNPNTGGKTLPPGMGIHGQPKGPSEQ